MDLHIMGLRDALDYAPDDRTYAIRIHCKPDPRYKIPIQKLKDSALYIAIMEYFFDDIDPRDDDLIATGKYILFDEELAGRMLSDFDNHKNECDCLLIHCTRGINRSPPVGIAFNEIYNLGHDTEALKKKYPDSNRHVYHTLMNVAKKRK